MTLNQVIRRISQIALAHKQIRNFYQGRVSNFLTDKTTRYASVFMQDNGGRISITGHATTLNYKLFFLDLVHVSEDTKRNEQDVQSDMVSVAMDILAQINNGNYDDWKLSGDNNLQLVVEYDNDMVAGCIVDISLSIMFAQNICQIPTDLTNYIPIDTEMKLVYDEKYIATGAEGTTLSIPIIKGKKILFITRENNPIYKVSAFPDPVEYTWDDVNIVLGVIVNPGERFLILYRNY